MLWQFSGGHNDDIEPDIAFAILRARGKPAFGGADNAPPLLFGHGFDGLIIGRACLHLDEYQRVTPLRDNVDFACRTAIAPRQNAIAFRDQ